MSEQRYVYTTYTRDTKDERIGDLEAIVNEYANEGWRLTDTLEEDGTTVSLVFEREV
jgi:hypothetical protein